MPTGDFPPPPGAIWSDAIGWHYPACFGFSEPAAEPDPAYSPAKIARAKRKRARERQRIKRNARTMC